MSGPIEEFLVEVGHGGSAETLMELRGHLEESATGFVELGFNRKEAELAAIQRLGDTASVSTVVRERNRSWAILFGGDRKILLSAWIATSVVLLVLPLTIIGGARATPALVTSVGIYWAVVVWSLWLSTRAKRVGPFAVSTALVAGILTSSMLFSVLASPVPHEVGAVAYRWQLESKQSEFAAYRGEFWNHSLSGYSSLVQPGDISYEAAKRDVWNASGGAGILQTFWDQIFGQRSTHLLWLFLSLVFGVAGFFVRFVREGGFGKDRDWRVD